MKTRALLFISCLTLTACDATEAQDRSTEPTAVSAITRDVGEPGGPSQTHRLANPLENHTWSKRFDVTPSGRVTLMDADRASNIDPSVYRNLPHCSKAPSAIGELVGIGSLYSAFDGNTLCKIRRTEAGKHLLLEVGSRATHQDGWRWKKIGKYPADTILMGVIDEEIILTRAISECVYRGHDTEGNVLWERDFGDAAAMGMGWTRSGALYAALTIKDGDSFRLDAQAIDPRDGKSIRHITLDPTLSEVMMNPEETLRRFARQRADRALGEDIDRFGAGAFEVSLKDKGFLEYTVRRLEDNEHVLEDSINPGKAWDATIHGGTVGDYLVLIATHHDRGAPEPAPGQLIPTRGSIDMNVYDLKTMKRYAVWNYRYTTKHR